MYAMYRELYLHKAVVWLLLAHLGSFLNIYPQNQGTRETISLYIENAWQRKTSYIYAEGGG